MQLSTRSVVDVAVAGLVTAVMLLATAQSADQPARPFDVVVVIAVIVIGAWTAVAGVAPRTALVGAAVSLYVALSLDVPAFSPALAVGIPLFAAARAGHLWWCTGIVALTALTGVPYRLFIEATEPAAQVALSVLFDLALMVVLVLLGETLRSRWAVRQEAALRLRLAEQHQQQRLADERLRIARDLHDVLAHTLTVVGIQGGVAAENLDEDPERAREAVDLVDAASRDAMADLRSTISLLRDDAGHTDPHPAPGLAQLPDLLDGVHASGLGATLAVHGDPVGLRNSVDVTAYRVVQEALTNVLRHAAARSVTVDVWHCADAVAIEVRDDGQGAEPTAGAVAGAGLRGMAERVAAVGGTLDSGPTGDGQPGFVVRARLPAGSAS